MAEWRATRSARRVRQTGAWAALVCALGVTPLLGAQAPVHFPLPTPTPMSMTVAGGITVAGALPAAGTEIAVFTPAGRVCAVAVADSSSGRFILHVYGDDDTTPTTVEGLARGETVRFTVFDPARDGEVPHADLTVTSGTIHFADRLSLRADVTVPAEPDADGDGVLDLYDACPGTPAGLPVDSAGCSSGQRDDDGDGVANADDAFPTDPAASADTDGDGFPDGWNSGMGETDSTSGLHLDAFPADPGEWADTDLDGLGDNADTDDDGDGFSDVLEVAAGSDPLDPASVPSKLPPNPPTILSMTPDAGSPLTSFQVVLSSFHDPDDPDAFPAAVEWSLHSENLECELCSVEFRLAGQPTSLELPTGLLSADTRVFASARYVDADGLRSDWSDLFGLNLPRLDPEDTDGDGTEDSAEWPGETDIDADGVADPLQGWTVFREPEGGEPVGVRLDRGRLERLYVHRGVDLPEAQRPPMELPYGLYSFRVAGLPTGGAVAVTFYLPDPLPATAKWYKTSPNAGPVDYTARSTIAGNRVTLLLTDGEEGDADGVANGIVVDPSGLALPEPPQDTSGGGGGGGGCFVDILRAGSLPDP